MKILLIDGNSLGFAAHSMTKLTAGGRETQGIFGFLRSLRGLASDHPGAELIVFWDGKSWRKQVEPSYKANREETPEQIAVREAYRAQRPIMARATAALGVRMISAENLEADDLIALTVERFDGKARMIVVSGDKDLLQLVRPGCDWFDPIRNRRISHGEFAEFTGYADPDAFVQGKALLGDISDNLKGVAGIGEKGAPILLREFGSVSNAIMRIRQEGDAAIPESLSRYRKRLREFAGQHPGALTEGVDIFMRNMKLMKLSKTHLPAPVNLRNIRREFDEATFLAICEENAFISILKDHAAWTRPFRRSSAVEEAA